jgi:hypothetical protein
MRKFIFRRLRVPGNKVLRRMFKTEKQWNKRMEKVTQENMHNLYSSHGIVRLSIERRMRWTTGGSPVRNKLLEKKSDDNIEIGL